MKRSFVAASLLISSAPLMLAEAQEADRGRNESVTQRARPEYDPLGVRLGAFDLRPQVALSAEYNDNVFARDTVGVEEDYIFAARPELWVNSTWARHGLALHGFADTNMHQDFDSEDRTDYGVDGVGRLDIYRDSSISLGGSYAQLTEPRTVAEARDPAALGSEQVEYTILQRYVEGVHTFNRLRATARASWFTYDYDDIPSEDQDFRDRDELIYTGRLEFALSPDSAIVGQVSYNEREYDTATDRDSSGIEYLAGLNADLTKLIRGELIVGYTTQDYDNPAIGEVSGVGVRANLEYFATPITTITLRGAREVRDSGIVTPPNATSYFATTAGAQIDHELLRNVILSANVDYEKGDFEVIDREDDYWTAGAGVRYLVNRNVEVGARYNYSQYESEGLDAAEGFEVNRFLLSVTLKL